MREVDGKVAVVTGAASGIGRATALAYAREGARVVVSDVHEYAAQGVRVNAVGPAFIRTPLLQGLEDQVLPLHPIGRLGTSEEIADLVLFLSSDRASFITGSHYPVDGVYLAR